MPLLEMNGIDSKPDAEFRRVEHLPTPSLSPEPEDVASSADRRSRDENGTAMENRKESAMRYDGSGHTSTSSSSRRPSIANDDAILSDTSERTRPLHIKRPGDGRRKSSVSEYDKVLRLSPKQIHELTNEAASIPVRAASPILEDGSEGGTPDTKENRVPATLEPPIELNGSHNTNTQRRKNSPTKSPGLIHERDVVAVKGPTGEQRPQRPVLTSRAISTPPIIRRKQSSQKTPGYGHVYDGEGDKRVPRHVPTPLNLDHKENKIGSALKPSAQDRERSRERDSSSMPFSMPLPPFSMPTFLSLELAADRPSPLYIYRPSNTDFPYESSKIKYERLLNFLFLPPKLEGILGFGALACLDAWMHILTILPLRFLIALAILAKWWGSVILKEVGDLWAFVYSGLGRVWSRWRGSSRSQTATPLMNTPADDVPPPHSRRPSLSATPSPNPAISVRENGNAIPTNAVPEPREKRTRPRYRHRRTKSTPSALLPSHKADLLKGLLVVASCVILMRFDASKMYHGIRGQSAIKLYVIYNVLEVCDRLLSAVGQDVLECLLSRETLDRSADGRSKVIRPFWMFVLALAYNVAHATALFYQVITLNVAVNSYSNALLTLLLSNQFVEIKGTVFKRFEKENLFQLTCADIVERFQLWLMLLIIGMRNIVEVGGLSVGRNDAFSWRNAFGGSNSTAPFTASSILPLSFTIFPKWIGQVLNPFLLVLGSEMLVDWLKHAYITKFNQTKPEVYDKFLDVLAKDYYSSAFTDHDLTRRLGLPVLPLACLFIRAATQTYHMFIATHMPLPYPSTATSLTESASTSSPSTTAALAHIDQIFRRALGRSAFGGGASGHTSWTAWLTWTFDDFIAIATMATVFLVGYLFFLAFKVLLGMLLLSIARNRYHGMKERERLNTETGGKRLGGFGLVDVDEEKRRWIYNDDPESLKRLNQRDEKQRKLEEREKTEGTTYGHVSRYSMVAKRIW